MTTNQHADVVEEDSFESWLAVNGIDEEDRPVEHPRETPGVDVES